MKSIVYLIIRLAVGMSMFGHGIVRLPKIKAFAEGMVEQFAGTYLPEFLVSIFGYVLPVAEFVVGLLLIIGYKTAKASTFGAFIMIALIFGSCMKESFGSIPSQMIHTFFFALLIQFEKHKE